MAETLDPELTQRRPRGANEEAADDRVRDALRLTAVEQRRRRTEDDQPRDKVRPGEARYMHRRRKAVAEADP